MSFNSFWLRLCRVGTKNRAEYIGRGPDSRFANVEQAIHAKRLAEKLVPVPAH
jgi:hypothetical protein